MVPRNRRFTGAGRVNPFRTAVPFWGHSTLISSTLSPNRDCGSKGVNTVVLVARWGEYRSLNACALSKRLTWHLVHMLVRDGVSLVRSVFNMSGRRRLAFESDGKWEGPMSQYLVVIGVGMDLPGISAALEGMRVDSSVSR